MSEHNYMQDRELSWLAFNDRVLSEAMDETVPLLERLKFAAIFTSNLDEFFMIRVGSLYDLANLDPDTRDSRSGMTPKEQLSAIYEAVKPLYRKREHICAQLEQRLRSEGIVRLSARDPAVISIKMTIYRLASRARLVDYLCEAAERGKDVTVIIELRARFDELNNIDWSERLEEAGCSVIYGFEDYKIHSKLCLITRRERGEIRCITYAGTGNFNEKTAAQYTDLALLTADPAIGRDAAEFFKNMSIANLDGHYERLLVAPSGLKKGIIACMDREIAKGQRGRMLIKVNSITDTELIEKLREASQAGVQTVLIVRGICCILPGVPGETDGLRIVSIVGRFLEHSRVYCFGEGADELMYISSADFMTRNTRRRVEVACPVTDAAVRRKLHHILDVCLSDNVKARQLLPDGSYTAIPSGDRELDCQRLLMEEAMDMAPQKPIPHKAMRLAGRIFRKILGNINEAESS